MNRIALTLAMLLVSTGTAWATVDVNTATREQLEAEGMGPVAAQAIIDHRTKNGPFKSSDEVQKVINDAIAAKLSIGISISGPAPAKAATSAEAKPAAKEDVARKADKPAESKSPVNNDELDNVRNRAKKDQDDRKT